MPNSFIALFFQEKKHIKTSNLKKVFREKKKLSRKTLRDKSEICNYHYHPDFGITKHFVCSS